jgi:hypothetical protein
MKPCRSVCVLLVIATTAACAARTTESARTPQSGAGNAIATASTNREWRLAQLDEYLRSWDALARGDRDAAAVVLDASKRERFEQTLIELLRARDGAAPARLVFYQAVQIFNFLDVDSPLGAVTHELLGEDGPTAREREYYLPVHLYVWWKKNRARFEPLPLLEGWERWEENRALIAGWLNPPRVAVPPGAQPATLPFGFPEPDKEPGGAQSGSASSTDIRGSLPKEAIRAVITSHLSEVRRCYEGALETRPKLVGRVEIKFVIAPLGVVAAATVKSSEVGEPLLEHCIARAVRSWLFPRPEDRGIVVVTYPFVLEQATGAGPAK